MRLIGSGCEVELAVMITVAQIRERLIDLLASKEDSSLDDFDEWLAGASWNMHQDSDLEAQWFAAEIELALAENESNIDLLRRRLKDILHSQPVTVNRATVKISTGSSTTSQHQEWPFAFVGKLRVVVYG